MSRIVLPGAALAAALALGTGIFLPIWVTLVGAAVGFGALLLPLFVSERRRAISAREIARWLRSWAAGADVQRDFTVARELRGIEGAINEAVDEWGERTARLEAARQRLEAVLLQMQEGVIVVGPSRRIELLNPAAEQMLRVKREELLERHFLTAIPDYTLEENMKAVSEQGRPRTWEWRTPDDRRLQIGVAPVNSPVGLDTVLVIRDVTVERQLEEMRKDFVANVSHELKTPLTAIRGFVETVLGTSLSDAQRERFLTVVLSETSRLERLIDDLLDLSRLESGEAMGRKEPVDLKTAVRDVKEQAQLWAEGRGVELLTEVEGEHRVWADPDALRQILINLVDNALKYTPRGGRVTIRTESGPASHRLVVEDNGPGIPAQDLPRVFERFYRVQKDRSRSSGGTGLGLAIVKHLAQSQGGWASVESTPGEGSRFWVTLPALETDDGEEHMGDPRPE